MATKKQENENLPAQQEKKPPTKLESMRNVLETAVPKFREVAPKHLNVNRVIRLLLAASGNTPKILDCTQDSVLRFCMKCSETGLEPIGAGGAWPIPYKRKKNGQEWYELTFIPDFRGMINAAKIAGVIKDAYAEVVYSEDFFEAEMGMEPKLIHKPKLKGSRGTKECAYCIIVLPDDTRRYVLMGEEEILGIRNRSQAWQSFKKGYGECPWSTDEAEMWKKTVTRRAMKQFQGANPILDNVISADDDAMQVQLAGQKPEPIAMPREVQAIEESKDEPEELVPEPAAVEGDLL